MKHSRLICLLLPMLFIAVAPAYAYIGPGPGLSMLGSLFTLIGGVFLAFFMVLLYPIRLLLKRRKQNKKPSNTEQK